MPERFGEMEKAVVGQRKEFQPTGEAIQPSDRELMQRLGEYPELKAKIENMLGIIENAGGDVEKAAEVECREYSQGLQRAMTDLGADHAFAGAAAKLKEHYGIEVPGSAVRMVTGDHGATMLAQGEADQRLA